MPVRVTKLPTTFFMFTKVPSTYLDYWLALSINFPQDNDCHKTNLALTAEILSLTKYYFLQGPLCKVLISAINVLHSYIHLTYKTHFRSFDDELNHDETFQPSLMQVWMLQLLLKVFIGSQTVQLWKRSTECWSQMVPLD